MNRIDFSASKSERRFYANPHPAQRSKRLFIMINRFEHVSFPVEIRRLEMGRAISDPVSCFARVDRGSYD